MNMKQEDFDAALEELTPSQKKVLRPFLDGKTDQVIASNGNVTESNVRHHINKICEKFGIKNQEGQRLSLRDDLIDLFAQYKPDWVNSEILKEFNRQPKIALELPYPEGSVPLDSPYYIERPGVESKCYETILQPGSLIRIKAPKQMGKTSLLNRIIAHAESKSYRTARLNLLDADEANFRNLNEFLRWFSANITLQLGLPDLIDNYGKLAAVIGSKLSCKNYFEKHLLQQIESPLVLALDEVDRIFQYPEIYQEFFPMLRSLHEEANNQDIWKKLRLVVVHSTEDYGRLPINQSPFNVGLPIELSEFTPEQVQSLAKQHQLDLGGGENLASFRELVGGHPYLVRLALYYLARQEVTLKKLLQDAPTDAGIYRHHLHRHGEIISKNPLLAEGFKQVITADKPVQLETTVAYKLYSMGLIKLQGNDCISRCELYRRYFLARQGNQTSETGFLANN